MDKLRRLLSTERSELERRLSPYFYHYHRDSIFESELGFDGYLDFVKYIFGMSDSNGKKILDYGCGFGLISLIFSYLGAKSVTSVDINSEKIEVMNKLIKQLDIGNVRTKKIGSKRIPFPDKSFDVVLAIEVISHVSDLDSTLSEMARVLKDGGLLLVIDGNNKLSIPNVLDKRRVHHLSEYDGSEEIGLPLSYVEMRKNMIKKRFPTIDSKKLDLLSRKTKGLWGDKIHKAVEEYLDKGKFFNPHKKEFRNPITGEFQERLFNPYSVGSTLRRNGFCRVEIFPSLPLSSKRSTIRKLLIPFYPLIFLFSESFEIIARK